jgi:hypothetical protein
MKKPREYLILTKRCVVSVHVLDPDDVKSKGTCMIQSEGKRFCPKKKKIKIKAKKKKGINNILMKKPSVSSCFKPR